MPASCAPGTSRTPTTISTTTAPARWRWQASTTISGTRSCSSSTRRAVSSSSTGTPGAPTTTQEVQIGHYAGLTSGGYFAGVIDDVRIWANAWPNGFPACALDLDSSTVAPASHVIEED